MMMAYSAQAAIGVMVVQWYVLPFRTVVYESLPRLLIRMALDSLVVRMSLVESPSQSQCCRLTLELQEGLGLDHSIAEA